MAMIRSGEAGKAVTDIPITVVTADSTDRTRKEILRLGASDYLTKPVKGEPLFKKTAKNFIGVQ
jgi:DNA-binding response OmpR family regulator